MGILRNSGQLYLFIWQPWQPILMLNCRLDLIKILDLIPQKRLYLRLR